MAKAPYLPLFCRNWLCSRRVLAMPPIAVKAYVYLLCESWLQEPRATLPDNDIELSEMARVSVDEWAIIKPVLMPHFLTGKCRIHQGRLYSELLLETSRKFESNQRFRNKNADKSRIKRDKNTALDTDNANANTALEK